MELQQHVNLLSPEKITLITLLLFVVPRENRHNSPLCLAAGCHGRTDAGQRAHPCGDHGYRRRLHDRAAPFPLRLGAGDFIINRDHRRSNGLFRRYCGADANRHQRVLAYSTVSQLGYMFVAIGIGAFSAAIFHLFTHAFFKACLFLAPAV